jgi:hypothetical protein
METYPGVIPVVCTAYVDFRRPADGCRLTPLRNQKSSCHCQDVLKYD